MSDQLKKGWVLLTASEPWCRYDDDLYESENEALRRAESVVQEGDSDLVIAELVMLVESPRRGVKVRKLK